MSSLLDGLVRKYGAPSPAKPFAPGRLDALSGKLPPDLLAFWRDYGAGAWLNGKFQFCDPADFKDVTEQVFEGDPDLDPAETHLVGYSAFGELLFWNQTHERVVVDLPQLRARVPAFDARGPKDANHFLITTPLSRLDHKGSFDVFEQDDKAELLFDRTLARLGPVDLGECYGFVPALAFGGSARLDRIQRLDASVHFSIIAGAGRCRGMVARTPGAPVEKLRDLGPA